MNGPDWHGRIITRYTTQKTCSTNGEDQDLICCVGHSRLVLVMAEGYSPRTKPPVAASMLALLVINREGLVIPWPL